MGNLCSTEGEERVRRAVVTEDRRPLLPQAPIIRRPVQIAAPRTPHDPSRPTANAWVAENPPTPYNSYVSRYGAAELPGKTASGPSASHRTTLASPQPSQMGPREHSNTYAPLQRARDQAARTSVSSHAAPRLAPAIPEPVMPKPAIPLPSSLSDQNGRPSSGFAMVLIDGDRLLFDDSLMERGHAGGIEAAQAIRSAIFDLEILAQKRTIFTEAKGRIAVHAQNIHISIPIGIQTVSRPVAGFEAARLPIVIMIFLNKHGLKRAMSKSGAEVSSFGRFWEGVSQAHELLSVVDVGWVKEGADCKIKAQLDLSASNAECKRIYAGISHDQSYISALHSKLVLLRGTLPGHRRVEGLGLPMVVLHGVFRAEELVVPATKTPELMSIAEGEPALVHNPFVDSSTISDQGAAAVAAGGSPKGCRAPTRALKFPRKGTKEVSGPAYEWDPPPCHYHYLSKTPDPHQARAYQGAEAGCHHLGDAVHCENFGHDYDPTPQQWLQIRKRAKRFPCYAFNDGKCKLAEEDCFMAHKCPDGSSCSQAKQDIPFSGKDASDQQQMPFSQHARRARVSVLASLIRYIRIPVCFVVLGFVI